MIELQDHNIALTTVDAWMSLEEGLEKGHPLLYLNALPLLRGIDVMLPILQVVLSAVSGPTGTAVDIFASP